MTSIIDMSNTPAKVTDDMVKQAIAGTTYTVLPDGRTTICQITLDNGFTVYGSSVCVAKENFNKALGQAYSYENAIDEVWTFLGFRLAERRHLQTKLDEFIAQYHLSDLVTNPTV